MALFRAQSVKYLTGNTGTFLNPNLSRQRLPRDMDPEVHNSAGRWFTKNFEINYRELAIFCTGSQDTASGYVTPGKVLIKLKPVAPYSICFSETCKDLFGHFQFVALRKKLDEAAVWEELDSLKFSQYIDSGLEDAAASGNEVMIFATEFSFQRI